MKSITLIKHHPCVQLAHLYEHLFLRRVNDFFYAKHLFKSLDYYAHGTTTEDGGVIIVEVGVYSSEAVKYLKELEKLSIEYGAENSNVSTALLQIIAEEPQILIVTNKSEVLAGIREIDDTPWQSIDKIHLIEIADTIQQPIHLTEDEAVAPSNLYLTITANSDIEKSAYPLFNLIGRTLLLTATNHVCSAYGLYAGTLSGKPSPLSITSELLAAPGLVEDIDISSVLKTAHVTIENIIANNLAQRIHHNIQQIDYLHKIDEAPSIESLIHETGVLIGSDTWKRVGTINTINQLLMNISLELHTEHSTVSLKLHP